MTFPVKSWGDFAAGGTPITGAALIDLETRLSTYTDVSLAGRSINVKASPYNAVGDGVTDDTTAVQDAITAAGVTGGTVFFPGGTYVVRGLSIPGGVVLDGMNGLSYLEPPTAPISRLLLKPGSIVPLISPQDTGHVSTGVQILDMVLDTNNIAQPAINIPDSVTSVPRFWLIERCYITNSGFSTSSHGSHVYIGNLNTGVTMRDCQLLSNAAGNTTQQAHGWDGVGWYGSDGLMENTFIGCYSDAGMQIYGGAADITLLVVGGGTFWNNFGLLVGGQGAVFQGMSIDHNYNDGAFCAFSTSFSHCTFHSNGVQTDNTYSHIRVSNPVPVSVVGCRVGPQSSDAGPHICKYFINAVAGASVSESSNYKDVGATLGTAWRIPNIPQIASAATVTLLVGPPLQDITGTTTITSIAAGETGQVVTLRFAGSLTLTDGSNLKIAGDFVATVDDTITLVSDGTNWNEISRSLN